ncbi:uncharacterized protein PHALS_09512 [Plasmopara halstedii]|uniref:GRIP domain-containing protein n=1 Tax=Plasmopara halstedii TaxID=4781 RepID=A0A0P1A5U5_PLAHL|nr:uncharacterized protein PHALS_09512 [Plasmopara halstedii]CEG35390.1 hypothetical protein PHALS_09512 [Plasmopara halstedii]|eukprot:XP_024571759.1 hypothetical protein PHALS_09512 [Plasmopara halstedii]
MWSRLAEGIADIVAPEEIELEHEKEKQLNGHLNAVVAPSPHLTTANEADEQEQYICELERALLQRKKQNEALEEKVLETREEVQQLKSLLKAQEVSISEQKIIIDNFQIVRQDEKRAERFDTECDSDRLVQKLQESQAETAALRTQYHAQEKELIVLRDRVDELEAANETLRDDDREARLRAVEYEQGYMNLLAEMDKLRTTNEMEKKLEDLSLAESQKVYDLEARLLASEADKAVAQNDAERLLRNLNALEGVLHQFQVDSKSRKEYVATIEAELEQMKKELRTRQTNLKPMEEEASELQRVKEALEKKTRECDQLREALESTAMHYNSGREVLNKSLAAQLVVAYVDSTKKGEILQLMARMMDFTEEQKRRVGLSCPIQGNGGGGLFSSIIGLVAPDESEIVPVDPSAIEGKSFADMWSQFLLDEVSKGK